MIIHLPYINFDHFATIVALYDAKAAEYNGQVAIEHDAGNKSRNFLKSAHRELWFDYIRTIKGEMSRNLLVFKDAPLLLQIEALSPVILKTNRKRSSSRTKKSEATIYRLTERLIDAGVILEKKNHGTQRDYELFLNPEMIPVWDYKNEDFDPLTYTLKNGSDKAIQAALRSICTPCSSNMNILNKRIITQNNPEHKKVSPKVTTFNEQTRTHTQNTGDPEIGIRTTPMMKINTFNDATIPDSQFEGEIQAQNSIKINTFEEYSHKLELLRKKEEERKRKYAIMFVEFVISILFPGRQIYKSEREKAYQYGELYFSTYQSDHDCFRALEIYQERVRLVRRWLDNNTAFDFSNVWPAHYIDPDNRQCGFINTKEWLKKHRKYKELQFKTRKLKTEQGALDYALTRLKEKWTNSSSFAYWRSYIINKAPSRVQEYEIAAKAILENANKLHHKSIN
jgi:hypothetical protein